jgi:EAL domain-containing protein (putative c-di-GMP-specific phosphodiesterase class I)
VPLGQWVLEQACSVLAQWQRDPLLEPLTLAVNVSAHQVQQPGFVLHLKQLLERSGCNPHRLKLELTESAFIGDEQTAIRAMTALRALGIRFSLDDFGTGYLAQPPQEAAAGPDQDRPVLRAGPAGRPGRRRHHPGDHPAGAQLRHGGDGRGVELPAQRSFLESLGCHAFQGFLFARPNPCSPSRPSATNIWLRRAPALMPRA